MAAFDTHIKKIARVYAQFFLYSLAVKMYFPKVFRYSYFSLSPHGVREYTPKRLARVQTQTLLEVLDAAHLSAYVDGPFPERGGIMIVGPPGALKTSMIRAAYDEYSNAIILSDTNIRQLSPLRDQFLAHRYRTLAFPDFKKLYQRNSSSAENIEGCLSAFVAEGFERFAHEPAEGATLLARVFVCAAMTYEFQRRMIKQWVESGFARRFLWVTVSLKNGDKLLDAIHKWKRLTLGEISRKEPRGSNIPYTTTEQQSRRLQLHLKSQFGDSIPLIMMNKIVSVLNWKYKDDDATVQKILKDFYPAIGERGAEIEL